MQQQITQDWNHSRYKCDLHECQTHFLYFGDSTNLKSRLLCINCIIGLVNSEKVQPTLINIKDFMNNPLNELIKITRINGSLIKANEIEQLKELEKYLLNFEEVVKKQIDMVRQNITQLQEPFGQVGSEVSSNLKLNDIVDLFQQLSRMDSYQGTKELQQLEEKLNNISTNLSKTFINAYQKVRDKKPKILEDTKNSLQTIERENSTLQSKTLEILFNVLQFGIPAILQDDLGGFPEIHQQISYERLAQYQLIYQGTKDGLNAQAYWAKCNQQSNLLTIMTSKNGNRFGGYSPCLINSVLNNYVKDPAMKSFLFQYNKKQIYKLKNQVQAAYCNSVYGPTYGGGHDLNIAADFIGGYSNLGNSYDTSGYNIVDKANHIFGDKTPQLQECKVYKVIF